MDNPIRVTQIGGRDIKSLPPPPPIPPLTTSLYNLYTPSLQLYQLYHISHLYYTPLQSSYQHPYTSKSRYL